MWFKEENMIIDLNKVACIQIFCKGECNTLDKPHLTLFVNDSYLYWHYETDEEANKIYNRLCHALSAVDIRDI